MRIITDQSFLGMIFLNSNLNLLFFYTLIVIFIPELINK